MATDDRPQKISVGFIGGQVLSARVAPAELTRLRNSLGREEWFDLPAEDGTIAIDLGRVVYVLVDNEGHRVGFGT